MGWFPPGDALVPCCRDYKSACIGGQAVLSKGWMKKAKSSVPINKISRERACPTENHVAVRKAEPDVVVSSKN